MNCPNQLSRSAVAVLAIAIAGLPFAAVAADQKLSGTYKLISSSRTLVDTGQVETYAKEQGFITYGDDGRMLVLILRGDRPKPESLAKMTDQQRADLFRTLNAYGGTYSFDGKTVEHHIDISANEVWTGTTQIRDIKREGERLIYTTRWSLSVFVAYKKVADCLVDLDVEVA
jgi:hypothetical protein